MKNLKQILKKTHSDYFEENVPTFEDEETIITFVYFPDYKGIRKIEPTKMCDLTCPRCNKKEFFKLVDHNFKFENGIFCKTCTIDHNLYWHPTNINKTCPKCGAQGWDTYLHRSKTYDGKGFLNCSRCFSTIVDDEPWHGTEVFILDNWKENQ